MATTNLQQTVIHHPGVRMKLGLPTDIIPNKDANSDKIIKSESTSLDPNRGRTSIQDLAPRELLAVSVQNAKNICLSFQEVDFMVCLHLMCHCKQLSVQVISEGNKNEGISLLE